MSRTRALALALTLLAPGLASAAACCLSSSAFGVGRLALWEDAAVLGTVSAAPSFGRWDVQGRWVPEAAGAQDLELRASLSALLAVHDRVQLSARLPWVVNRRTADALVDVAHGPGDALLGARVEVLAIGAWQSLPGVALTAGLTAPLGRTMAQTVSPLAADVTGRGAWVPSLSAAFEYAVQPWYAQLNVGGTFPLPMAGALPGSTQRFGNTLELGLAAGRELRDGLVLSLVARATFEAALTQGGDAVPGSGARDVGLGPSVSWKWHPHWTLQAGLDSGLFFGGVGSNRQGRASLSAGLRYAFF